MRGVEVLAGILVSNGQITRRDGLGTMFIEETRKTAEPRLRGGRGSRMKISSFRIRLRGAEEALHAIKLVDADLVHGDTKAIAGRQGQNKVLLQ